MDRPNILFITSDQQHWRLLGCQNPEVRTPHLDRLAAEGTLFERAYCPNPTCTPTRASIITGLYPSQHGAYSLGTKLPESVPTVGQEFSRHGYATDLIGKAHFQGLKGTAEYPSLESYPTVQDLEFWRGFNGPFYGFEHLELARNHVDGAVISTPFFVSSRFDFVQAFVGDWEARFGESPDVFGALGYDSANLVMLQLAGGAGSRDDVRDGLLRVRGYPGVSGVTTMQPDGNARRRPYMLGVQKGRIVGLD